MPEYLSPGVYVEEVDRGPKPIEGVGIAMAVFIGFTEKAQSVERVDGETLTRGLLNKPQLVTNWSQFSDKFGGFVSGAYLSHAVYGYFSNGGTRCYVLSVKTIPKAQAGLLNGDGKPMLIAQARQAGFEGARPPAPDKKARASKETAEGQPAEGATPSAGDGANPYFHITVGREWRGGGWKTEEIIRNAALVEVEEDGVKRVAVSYANNKRPTLIDLLWPMRRPCWPKCGRANSSSRSASTRAS
ncbi:MAG: hypothetical protein NZM14_10360 [Thermoflexales bacterium]|nr:hypothetical protein [Thermoflexales bacterium]